MRVFGNGPGISRSASWVSSLLLITFGATWVFAPDGSRSRIAATGKTVSPSAGRPSLIERPLSFEPNVGQANERAQFLVRSPGVTTFIASRGSSFAIDVKRTDDPMGPSDIAARQPQASHPPALFELELVGASETSKAMGFDELPGKVNYFIGNRPSAWRTNVPTYAKVKLADVYPGIDCVYYGTEGQLEYDFVVGAGADPDQVRLRFRGIEKLDLDETGNLIIQVAGQKIRQLRPSVYQEVDGRRRPLGARYILAQANEVAFRIERYETARPLVIDPVLLYSTYLGGSGREQLGGVAVDRFGNIYIAGTTSSIDFPLANPFQADPPSYRHAFLTKLNPAGSALVYSTYFGGDAETNSVGVALDPNANPVIAGSTTSIDLPMVNAFQPNLGGGACFMGRCWDAYLAKFAENGSSLIFSTYLGGTGDDYGTSVASDSQGNTSIVGVTSARDFPTVRALQADRAGAADAFVAKLDPSGSPRFSTYLGGSADDSARAVATDATGNVYLTGATASEDFPTARALQPSLLGNQDAFVSKINPDGSALVYSTYLGGRGSDSGEGISVDAQGNAYLTGKTTSGDYPTAYAMEPSPAGAFVSKLNADGSALVYSTYLGGNDFSDWGRSIAVDGSGNAHVAGFRRILTGQAIYQSRLFATALNREGRSLWFYFSPQSDSDDIADAVATDSIGNTYVAGHSTSTNYPTAAPFQSTRIGVQNAVLTKIALLTDPVSSFADAFADTAIDHLFWSAVSQDAEVSEGDGSINIALLPDTGTSTGILNSKSVYSLRNSQAWVKVEEVVGSQGHVNNQFSLQRDWNNALTWWFENSRLNAMYFVNGQPSTLASLDYSPSIHTWWRIREAFGTVYWDTSTDGTNWTTQASVSSGALFSLDAVNVVLFAREWGSGSTDPGTARYSNLNVRP